MRTYRPWLTPLFSTVGLLFAVTACSLTPTPSPAPTGTPTLVPEPTATATQVEDPTPTATLAPTRTPVPTATATPTPEPTQTPTSAVPPTATQAPTSTKVATQTPTSTATQTPEPTATERPTQTATPMQAPTQVATPTPTPLPARAGWRGEYYANPDLAGEPALVRDDPVIGFDWEDGAPAPGLPIEGFSVRWSRVVLFEQGTYHFNAAMDDGMRVYVDDELLIDEWQDRSERQVSVARHMSAGNHALRVEYYDRRHGALADLWWEPDRTYPDWKGIYWPNQDLLGNPALIRNDPHINFDWQMGSPGVPVPEEHFSVRWTRTIFLEEGLYRFQAFVDDGVRIWVDGQLIVDAWSDHQQRDLSADYTIAGVGAHTVRVEYYDNTFHARANVSLAKVGPPSYPEWKGEYYTNPHLSGDPNLIRNDGLPNFEWEDGAPAPGVPADGFSVRWTREREFEPGVYRFVFHVDDGIRFYVDDELVLDEWHQTWGQTYQVDVTLSWKPKLVLEFYEGTGDARIRSSWERIR